MLSSKWQFYNIIILGTGFLLLFTAFQTTANVETTTIGIFFSSKCHSAEAVPYADKVGFYSLCIIYFFVSVFTWLSPPITGLLGQKLSLIICGGAYCLLMGALIRPLIPTVFVSSAILGAAGGVLWTAQGQVLFANSNPDTVGRNSGIFWLMLESSLVIGNLYYYLFVHFIAAPNASTSAESSLCFDHTKNIILYASLTGLGVIGVSVFIFIRRNKNPEEPAIETGSPETVSDVQPLISEQDSTLSETAKDIQRLEGASVSQYSSKYVKLFITAKEDFSVLTTEVSSLQRCLHYRGVFTA
jgi:hypothetical protein